MHGRRTGQISRTLATHEPAGLLRSAPTDESLAVATRRLLEVPNSGRGEALLSAPFGGAPTRRLARRRMQLCRRARCTIVYGEPAVPDGRRQRRWSAAVDRWREFALTMYGRDSQVRRLAGHGCSSSAQLVRRREPTPGRNASRQDARGDRRVRSPTECRRIGASAAGVDADAHTYGGQGGVGLVPR